MNGTLLERDAGLGEEQYEQFRSAQHQPDYRELEKGESRQHCWWAASATWTAWAAWSAFSAVVGATTF
jgi:hypothetical protein